MPPQSTMEYTGNPIMDNLVLPLQQFRNNVKELSQKAERPEYDKVVKDIKYVALGFVLVGLAGFAVKLVAMPIKHILSMYFLTAWTFTYITITNHTINHKTHSWMISSSRKKNNNNNAEEILPTVKNLQKKKTCVKIR
jgi:preprotein translocase subunit Sss1